MGEGTFRIGQIEVVPVSDGTCKIPPEYFTNSDWSAHRALLGPDGMITAQLGCFALRLPGSRTVLVDAGVGPYDNALFQGGRLPGALEDAGIAPDEIDVVVCTHLHADHAGWLVQDSEPFFPNATVRFGRADWDQFVTGDDGPAWIRDAMVLLDERGRLDPIDGDQVAVAPGITARAAPGHTHGHLVYVIASGTDRAVLLGDAITCPVQLQESDWGAISDVDPAAAARTRATLLQELEGGPDVTVAAHFPDLRFGRVVRGEGRRYFQVA
jgi:glyoxylase-like metal-dependent hydrolase (beta-lactamase superfamily II)